MKRLLLVAACIVATVGALAQGTVNFANKVAAAGIDAPVLNVDGTKLAGADYLAQLYAGTTAGSLSAVGSAIPFKVNGYFSGGATVIPGIAGGATAILQVRAWAAAGGATYELALAAGGAAGMSAEFGVALGNPAAEPPTVPADLKGLVGFKLAGGPIPEPTTIALGALAAGALLLFRRK